MVLFGTEAPGDVARRHAGRRLTHQQAEHLEPALLGERAQRADRGSKFHISRIIEIYRHGQPVCGGSKSLTSPEPGAAEASYSAAWQ